MQLELELAKHIQGAFKDLFDVELGIEEVSFQPTRKEFVGSHTFVTFPFGRQTKLKPHETAEKIGQHLMSNANILKSYNVLKGFLNLELSDEIWLDIVKAIASTKDYGKWKLNGQKVMVEYSSPNTNKPLHLGHLRNNFLGYSVSQILEASGYEVQKVNLINDRGIHICKSMIAYQKFGHQETPESSGIKGDHLVGKYYRNSLQLRGGGGAPLRDQFG